jgi:hypothetical protein
MKASRVFMFQALFAADENFPKWFFLVHVL